MSTVEIQRLDASLDVSGASARVCSPNPDVEMLSRTRQWQLRCSQIIELESAYCLLRCATLILATLPAFARKSAAPQSAFTSSCSAPPISTATSFRSITTPTNPTTAVWRKSPRLIKQVRKENPNVLLIDSGDTIQGTPLAYYHNKKNNKPPDPMMLAMSALSYDAMAVGNHEYNFGLKVLEKARSEAKFPWLSANTYNKGTNKTHYQPYIVKEIAGVRIAILGLTTPGIPTWENAPNYAGLEFREPLREAKSGCRCLRGKERADVVVIAMHMGLEQDLRTGEINPGQVPNENQAIAIAQAGPGRRSYFHGPHASRRAFGQSSMACN